MKVIFMGTPAFGVPSFEAIVGSDKHEIVAAFSQRPKKQGRKMQLTKSVIHQLADQHNIPVHTPISLRKTESFELIDNIQADIIVVVAYGFIIPQNILDNKKYGCLNIHPSKLPQYRGAAPLQRAIINGDDSTAVCIMQMDAGLDTGDVILQEELPISKTTNLVQLHNSCAEIGAKLLLQTLDNIENLPRTPQSEEGLSYASKLTKEEGKVDWQETAFDINCKVRGMNPWPGVSFEHNGNMLKILQAEVLEGAAGRAPGTILSQDMQVACGQDTILKLLQVKPAGSRAMSGSEYLRGNAKKEFGT